MTAQRDRPARAGRTELWPRIAGSAAGLVHQAMREWRRTPRPARAGAASGFRSTPGEPWPLGPRAVGGLDGDRFRLEGASLAIGPGGPWDTALPSRAFAYALHAFDWIGQLAATPDGAARALDLALGWGRRFRPDNAFAWDPALVQRRLLALARHGAAMTAAALPIERAALARLATEHANACLLRPASAADAADAYAAAALAGEVIEGPAGPAILARALERLGAALPVAVGADGVRTSRSPEAGLRLLGALVSLERALAPSGRPLPAAAADAIGRLEAGCAGLTLGDGRLAGFHGGRRIVASPASAAQGAQLGGFVRAAGGETVMVADADAPPRGVFAETACASALAFELTVGDEALVQGGGWSPGLGDPDRLRLSEGASGLALAGWSGGVPLDGAAARGLGPRLVGGPRAVTARLRTNPDGAWLDLASDAFADAAGLVHERQMFLAAADGDLRGEDRLVPTEEALAERFVAEIRFRLAPGVKARLAADRQAVEILTPGGRALALRTDVRARVETDFMRTDAGLEPGAVIILGGRFRADQGARVRWRLSPAAAGAASG